MTLFLQMQAIICTSHAGMRVFFSGTDMAEVKTNSMSYNYYLSVIVNNNGDIAAKLAMYGESEQFLTVKGNTSEAIKLEIPKRKVITTVEVEPIPFGEDEKFFRDRVREIIKRADDVKTLPYSYGRSWGEADSIHVLTDTWAEREKERLQNKLNKGKKNVPISSMTDKEFFESEHAQGTIQSNDKNDKIVSICDAEKFISKMLTANVDYFLNCKFEDLIESIDKKYKKFRSDEEVTYEQLIDDNLTAITGRVFGYTTPEEKIVIYERTIEILSEHILSTDVAQALIDVLEDAIEALGEESPIDESFGTTDSKLEIPQ